MTGYSDSQFFSDMGDMFKGTGDVAIPGVTDRTIEANTYPITRVLCDEYGIIVYERSGYEPLLISPMSPRTSRQQALRNAQYVLHNCNRAVNQTAAYESVIHPRSTLTRRHFIEQTMDACQASKMIERRGNDILKLKIGGDKFAELSAVEQAPAVTPVPVQSRMHSINFLAENEKFLARKVSECREGQGVLLTIKGNGDATTEIIGGSSGRGV